MPVVGGRAGGGARGVSRGRGRGGRWARPVGLHGPEDAAGLLPAPPGASGGAVAGGLRDGEGVDVGGGGGEGLSAPSPDRSGVSWITSASARGSRAPLLPASTSRWPAPLESRLIPFVDDSQRGRGELSFRDVTNGSHPASTCRLAAHRVPGTLERPAMTPLGAPVRARRGGGRKATPYESSTLPVALRRSGGLEQLERRDRRRR